MADTYTHKDLAQLCSVSETTIKSYRRKFPGFIPVLTRGKPIRFKKEAGDICLKIRECFDKGMSVREATKVLKENFKEIQVKPQGDTRPAAAPSRGVVSEEYLEKFFATAGQMMQGMASLATAQAKTGQRLQKLEDAIGTLMEVETRNSEMFSELMTQLKSAPVRPVKPAPAAEPTPPKEEPTSAQPEQKVRARKIVNVKGPQGDVKSYALEKENAEKPRLEQPSDVFLGTPIVIRNDQGEFLGVPGRLSLSGFVEILVREAEEGGHSHASWRLDDDNWIFTMDVPGGDSHELYFTSTTTPRGNLVVLLDRLDVNSKKTSPQFLQEFFKQVKDKI